MKNIKIVAVLIIFVGMVSCSDKRSPQVQYMPDMYVSVPYKTDGSNGLNGTPVNSKPVAGTIPRGGHPAYDIPNTIDGYEKAGAELTNPLESSEVPSAKQPNCIVQFRGTLVAITLPTVTVASRAIVRINFRTKRNEVWVSNISTR